MFNYPHLIVEAIQTQRIKKLVGAYLVHNALTQETGFKAQITLTV